MPDQSQKAGDNSSQIQVYGDLHQGLSLDEARHIAQIEARQVAEDHFANAEALALRRMETFADRIIQFLAQQQMLSALADPSFRRSFRKAQIGAACTDEVADYDLLVQLLGERAESGPDRKARTGLDAAIEVVDQVDDGALRGLTLFYVAGRYRPMVGPLTDCLDVLDTLWAQFTTGDLPEGGDWLDNLDILNAIRIISVPTELKPFNEFLLAYLPGLVSVGVEIGSEADSDVAARMSALRLNLPIIDHELKPGFRRLPFCGYDIFDRRVTEASLSPEQRDLAIEIGRDIYKIDQPDGVITEAFMAEVRAHEHLRLVNDWWDRIPSALQLTSAGRALARANAKRCDVRNMIPDLN